MNGMDETLLILGAGIYQAPLIKKARDMGFKTAVASIPGPYPGFDLADIPLYINTTDREAILEAAKRLNVKGILTTGTDVAIRSLGYACESLSLPGMPRAAADILADKARMKQAFKGKVSSPDFEALYFDQNKKNDVSYVDGLYETLLKKAGSIGFPLMVKACDSSGSRGVTKVRDADLLRSALDYSLLTTRTDHIIIEKAIEGHEIGLDAFISNGKIVYFAPHEKLTRSTKGVTIPFGHIFPFDCSQSLNRSIYRELENIISATGIDDCAVNCDLFVLPDGTVSIVEIGGRCGATCIPELITMNTGIDYYRQMILNAVGENLDFSAAENNKCMAGVLFSEAGGVLRSIDEAAVKNLAQSTGAEILIDYKIGDPIPPIKAGNDRIGHVIMPGGDRNELFRVMESVMDALLIE